MSIFTPLDRAAASAFELQGSYKGWIHSIEGLRGFAAFLVYLVHYATLIRPWMPEKSITYYVSETLFSIGNVGVDIFFAISGFLIYAMLIRRERPFLPYAKRRIARIYPVFLAVMLIYTALSFVVPSESKIPTGGEQAVWYLIANYLLLPGIFDIEPMIVVAWSLSYEMFFYLVIPIIMTVCGLRKVPGTLRILMWFLLWVGVYFVAPDHFRASMLIVGILVFETSQLISRDRGSASITLCALTAFAAVLAFKASIYLDVVTFNNAGKLSKVLLFGACYLLCIAVFCKDGWLSRCFSGRYFRYFGNMSYSFYLIHGLTLKFIFLVMGILLPAEIYASSLWFWVLFLPAFLASSAVSAALFLLVERPFSLDGVGVFDLMRSRSVSAS
ncbi:acyltransferase family protein [Denitrobaculum tricleocarpae]|uniref:Acyltransferase n=1 Tax=Denitrobaculum tricleocarpae TaxID=2591009 RepID=A0A545TG59_9PROT|nr:acyltransferase [Denitrobaculum tricleocarpae]TQV76178.1 acyltransferase [Denitrobaculum tricleocarpae]